MKRRILLLMMTALLSVGAWADSLWTGDFSTGWNDNSIGVDFPTDLTKNDVIRLTVHFDNGWGWSISLFEDNGNGWHEDDAFLSVICANWTNGNDTNDGGDRVIEIPITDDIITKINTNSKLWIGGNQYSMTSVDIARNGGLNLLQNSTDLKGWGTSIKYDRLLSYASVGDLIVVEAERLSGDWGETVSLRSNDDPSKGTTFATGSLGDYGAGKVTLSFSLTSDMLGSSGLSICGGWFTLYSVKLMFTHDVTIAGSITNGTVNASKSKAAYGETVTLTAAPDTGYEFGSLTVKDENGATVETSGSDGTYSFTMPATAVTVSATFNHEAEALSANDVVLSTDMIICTAAANTSVRSVATSDRYYSSSGELWVGSGEHNGWDLSLGRPVSTTEFSGVYLNYKSGTKNVKMEIVYENGTTQISDVLSGSNATTINFSKSGVVKYVKFIRDTDTDAMVAIRQIALKGIAEASTYEPTSSLTLTYETLEDGGGSSVEYDDSQQQFEIKSGGGHWAGWIFTLPIPTSLYKGVNFNMTSVPANGAIEIVYEGSATQTVKLTTGDNIVNFVHSGNITQIKFNVAGTYQMGTCSASNTYLAKITDAKYATYGAVNDAIDYTSASGLKAYIAKVESGVVKLTEVSKVPANTAVVLYAETADTYTLSTATGTTGDVSDNELKISDGTVTGNGSTIYVLANKTSNGVGFYKFKNGSIVPAGKVYLQIPDGSAPEFFGFGDGTTGIDEVRSNTEEVRSDYFDLQGRRVAQPTKGLYIVNGKKVIIK